MEPKAIVRAYFEAVLACVWDFGAAYALSQLGLRRTRFVGSQVSLWSGLGFRILGFDESLQGE